MVIGGLAWLVGLVAILLAGRRKRVDGRSGRGSRR